MRLEGNGHSPITPNDPPFNKKMNTMNRRTMFTLTTLAFQWAGLGLPAGNAIGQQAETTIKNQLVGTWMLVSASVERQDGSKTDTFGPNPKGILMFDGDGRFSLQEWRADLPKFASNNRLESTAEENKAIVQGSICYFGKYTLTRRQRH